jgi:glycerol-3-phosphate acyltransferase PlsX
MRILLDAMGGDHAPQAILDGALLAIPHLKRELVLLGDEKIIKKHAIAKHVTILHAPEIIEMTDKIKSLRSKPDAPINVGTKLVAESWSAYKNGTGTPDAFLSAGHSGAMMASALLTLGRLNNVERPAIATELPTQNGQGVVILDVGANVDCKPNQLKEFAIMGAFYAAANSKGLKRPKIGILSNGEEKSKGNELTRAAYSLLEGLPAFSGPDAVGEFVGYTESKEMFSGQVHVVVTDGFVGNLILKNSEALASTIGQMYKAQMKSGPFSLLGALLSLFALKKLKKKLDYRETGSAPLLGVAGYAFISHGRSDQHAIKNALLRVQEAMDAKMVERLETAMAK